MAPRITSTIVSQFCWRQSARDSRPSRCALTILDRVLGAHNPRVDRARSLLTKKGRREQGRFLLEGPTLIAEAARSGVRIEELFGTAPALDQFAEATGLEARGTHVHRVDERTLGRLCDVETPQGLVAVAPAVLRDLADLFTSDGIVLALAGLSDPGNAGTLLRTADAFGIDRVIFSPGAVEPYAPKVVRAAMGSLFRARVAVASAGAVAKAASGWTITGLDRRGEPIGEVSWAAKCVLVVGQERHGLGDWSAVCGGLAAIPMAGEAESLNASVAGAIALYEAARSRSHHPVKRV